MKILKIQFKNINNLKGEHKSIHFDQEPLASAGIFAITGPTGSGKSTLLDIITLSLFNRIPRYKKGISKKEIESLGSVVTHHTNDAYAIVEYQIRGNRYTSEWKVAKNRNGKFKDYEMFLYDASGQPLDLKKSEVPAMNESLIGLKYDQFVKSIILSQGQFSKFLKAEQNERGQLLENITGTSIYRKIGRKVFEKYKDVKLLLSTKKEILDSAPTLSEEEISNIEKELKEITSKKEVLDQKIKKLSENVQTKKEINSSQDAIKALLLAAQTLSSKKELFQTDLSKLQLHNKLAPVKDDIALYKDAENIRQSTAKNLEEYKQEIEKAKTALQACLAEMAKLSKQEVNEKNFMSVMRDFENEILTLDKDIENSKAKGKEIRERLNAQKEDYPHSIDNNPEVALGQLKVKIKELQAIISGSDKLNIQDSKSKLKKDKENYDLLLLIKHDYAHLKEGNEKLLSSKTKLEEQQNLIKQNKPLEEKSGKLVQSLTEQITTLEKRKEDALKIQSLEQQRENLTQGEPCPLCGSLDHPYSIHNPNSEFSEIEKQIEKTKSELETQRKELRNLEKILTASQTSIQLIGDEIKNNELKLKETEITLKDKKQKVPQFSNLDENQIEKAIEKLGNSIEQLTKSIDALEESKIASQLEISFKQLNDEIKNYQEIKNLRVSKFDGEKITPITNALQNDFQKESTRITELSKAIEIESKDLERALSNLEKHKNKLQPKLESLGFQSIKEMGDNFLAEDEVSSIQKQENELNTLFTKNETQLKSHQSKLENLTKLDTQSDKSYEELMEVLQLEEKERESYIELIGEKNNQLKSDKENKEKQKSRAQEIEKLTAELDKWSLLNQMIGDANGNKFANFSQGLTLQNLLVYANHRLKNLSDRYLLDKPVDGGPLRVVDLFQGNTHRAVSTLSGGESFLISLALALSLSDMASKNVSLESLFIDEGFGTLDQETLDIAMNTLEKLQSENQKMVGVISHVEALKERITVQIKLEKNAQGFSNISVEQN